MHRCFQYIRADFDILYVNYTAKDIIANCGHHFEESIKIYLKRYNKYRWMKVSGYLLVQLLKHVTDNKIFDEEITEKLKLFVDLYNISKHVILSNEEKDREKETYKINWNKYGKNINRF